MPGIICKFTNSSSEKSSRQIFYWSEQRGKEFFFVENSLTVCYVDKIMNTCILLNHFRHLIWKAQRETDWWTKKASLAQYFWMKTSWNVSWAIVAVGMQNHNSDKFQPLAPYFEQSAMACCWLCKLQLKFNTIDFELERTTGKTLRVGTTHSFHWYFDSLPFLWLLHRTLNKTISKVIFNSRIWSW